MKKIILIAFLFLSQFTFAFDFNCNTLDKQVNLKIVEQGTKSSISFLDLHKYKTAQVIGQFDNIEAFGFEEFLEFNIRLNSNLKPSEGYEGVKGLKWKSLKDITVEISLPEMGDSQDMYEDVHMGRLFLKLQNGTEESMTLACYAQRK